MSLSFPVRVDFSQIMSASNFVRSFLSIFQPMRLSADVTTASCTPDTIPMHHDCFYLALLISNLILIFYHGFDSWDLIGSFDFPSFPWIKKLGPDEKSVKYISLDYYSAFNPTGLWKLRQSLRQVNSRILIQHQLTRHSMTESGCSMPGQSNLLLCRVN